MNYEFGYLIGAVVGGVVILYLMTRLILLAFRDKKHSTSSIVISAVVALGLANLLYGYNTGLDSPAFLRAILIYSLSAVIAVVIEVLRVRHMKARSRGID